MGRVLDARAESPRGLLGPGSKPGGGWRPPAGGPEGHAPTSGALTAPRDQVNTESATSLQTEEDESETQPTRAGWAPRPKRSAQNSAHRGHTAQWRDGQQAFQRGNHISQGGHEGTRESGPSLFQVNAALKHTAGAMWNPHQASETQVGWEAALPVAQSHIWAREESWGQQQRRDG